MDGALALRDERSVSRSGTVTRLDDRMVVVVVVGVVFVGILCSPLYLFFQLGELSRGCDSTGTVTVDNYPPVNVNEDGNS